MIGTFRWNLIAGAIGFFGTLAFSLPKNILKTALVQSLYSFLFLFIFTFLIRWVLWIAARVSEVVPEEGQLLPEEMPNAVKGQSIDLATPDEELLPGKASMQDEASFAPLNPPKLVTTKKEQTPEELAQSLRRMTEE